MSEESNNQQPVEAAAPVSERPNDDARPTEQRSTEERRPRRRFPRRRGRNRDRFESGSGADHENRGDVSENGDQQPLSEGGEQGIENGEQLPTEPGDGVIEISGKGFGFLRDSKRNFVQTPQDIFATPEIVRRFSLRDGMWIQGEIRRGNRGPQLIKLLKINEKE